MSDVKDKIVGEIPRLRRYARALTGDEDRADDLVQDCIVRAISRIPLWRDGNLRNWLFTIMHNLFANNIRRMHSGPQFVTLIPDHDYADSTAEASAMITVCDLQRSLAILAPEQREVLLLVGLEGMRYAEVAEVLCIPLGTVMSRLHRARTRLRSLMDGAADPNTEI